MGHTVFCFQIISIKMKVVIFLCLIYTIQQSSTLVIQKKSDLQREGKYAYLDEEYPVEVNEDENSIVEMKKRQQAPRDGGHQKFLTEDNPVLEGNEVQNSIVEMKKRQKQIGRSESNFAHHFYQNLTGHIVPRDGGHQKFPSEDNPVLEGNEDENSIVEMKKRDGGHQKFPSECCECSDGQLPRGGAHSSSQSPSYDSEDSEDSECCAC